MDKDFLRSLEIDDVNPNVELSKLGAKEIELLDMRDFAETNGADNRVKAIDATLEQLKVERERVKEEAKTHASEKEESSNIRQQIETEKKKKKDAYEAFKQKKNDEAQEGSLKSESRNRGTVEEAQMFVQNDTGQAVDTSSQAQKNMSQTQKNVLTKVTASVTCNVQQLAQHGAVASTVSSVSRTGSYVAGLSFYQKLDYENAFKCFVNVAENKKPADQTEAVERIQASYLLAMMYRDGIGTNKDIDRSNHYLKRAADFGYDQAQFEYGSLILSQHVSVADADVKARAEGWRYIENAADAGLVDAIKKYIDLAKGSSDTNKHVIAKAQKYILLIKGQLDSYEVQLCDDWIKELDDAKNSAKKRKSYPKKFVIGEILFLIGAIYLFKGLNPIFFEEMIPHVSRFIPDVPDYLIIKWDKLLTLTDPYMTHQGIFGGWLIILGNFIRGLGVDKVMAYSKKCKIFGKIIKISIIALCIAHFIANIAETSRFFGNGSYMQVVAMIVCIVVGRMLGKIGYKIIK